MIYVRFGLQIMRLIYVVFLIKKNYKQRSCLKQKIMLDHFYDDYDDDENKRTKSMLNTMEYAETNIKTTADCLYF